MVLLSAPDAQEQSRKALRRAWVWLAAAASFLGGAVVGGVTVGHTLWTSGIELGRIDGRAEARAECAEHEYGTRPMSADEQVLLQRKLGGVPNGVEVQVKFWGDSRAAWSLLGAIKDAFNAEEGKDWSALFGGYERAPWEGGGPPPQLVLITPANLEPQARAVAEAFDAGQRHVEVVVRDSRLPPASAMTLYVGSNP